MTKLKQRAVDMIERMPEHKLQYIIQIIEGVDKLFPDEENDVMVEAYNDLMDILEPIEPFDYNAELEEYRKEKYGL